MVGEYVSSFMSTTFLCFTARLLARSLVFFPRVLIDMTKVKLAVVGRDWRSRIEVFELPRNIPSDSNMDTFKSWIKSLDYPGVTHSFMTWEVKDGE